MTPAAESTQTSSAGTSPGGWVHFGVAAGVLLVAALAWFAYLPGLLSKRPVLPPEHAQFQEHRLYNFPETLGPYVLDPESESSEPEDGTKDGIHGMDEDTLQNLGTLKHDYNWYYMATYRDTRTRSASRRVRLEVTYYTGLVDAVPHVPERCIVAGGGEILRSECGPISVVAAGLSPPWDKIEVYRTAYQWLDKRTGRTGEAAQYHFFGMNGLPAWRWEWVRWETGKLTKKYCYFAKVQLSPDVRDVASLDASDKCCRDFLTYALPAILKFLPAAADVEKLEASGG